MTWRDTSNENGGRPCYTIEIGEGRNVDDWPGVDVSYGQGIDGKWRVRIDLFCDAHRVSDDFDDEETAKAAADAMVNAARMMWPEETT